MSAETLCHYDKIDLLKPQRTGEINGHRHREDSQIGTILLIGKLKQCGFSLAEIQALLIIPDSKELLRRLYKQGFRLEWRMGYISIIIREMGRHPERSERVGGIMNYQNNYEIQVKEAEEQILITHRHKVSVKEFGTYYRKIYKRIAKEHMTISGMIMAVYHDQESDPVYSDIELEVGIMEQDKVDFIMPGCLCTATIHRGPYSGLLDAYGITTTRINVNGYHMNGIPYEIYRKNQFDKPPSDE